MYDEKTPRRCLPGRSSGGAASIPKLSPHTLRRGNPCPCPGSNALTTTVGAFELFPMRRISKQGSFEDARIRLYCDCPVFTVDSWVRCGLASDVLRENRGSGNQLGLRTWVEFGNGLLFRRLHCPSRPDEGIEDCVQRVHGRVIWAGIISHTRRTAGARSMCAKQRIVIEATLPTTGSR